MGILLNLFSITLADYQFLINDFRESFWFDDESDSIFQFAHEQFKLLQRVIKEKLALYYHLWWRNTMFNLKSRFPRIKSLNNRPNSFVWSASSDIEQIQNKKNHLDLKTDESELERAIKNMHEVHEYTGYFQYYQILSGLLNNGHAGYWNTDWSLIDFIAAKKVKK